MISQRLDFTDGLWHCPSCGAHLTSGDLHGGDEGGNLEHRDDCAEVAAMCRRAHLVPVDESADVW